MYFCHIKNFPYGEINERSFSNPHPWTFGQNSAVRRMCNDVAFLVKRISIGRAWYRWYVAAINNNTTIRVRWTTYMIHTMVYVQICIDGLGLYYITNSYTLSMIYSEVMKTTNTSEIAFCEDAKTVEIWITTSQTFRNVKKNIMPHV